MTPEYFPRLLTHIVGVCLAVIIATYAGAAQWAAGDPAEGVPPINNGPDYLGTKNIGETFVINHDFDPGPIGELPCQVQSLVYYEAGRYELTNVQIGFGEITVTGGQNPDPGRCDEASPPADGTTETLCETFFENSTIGMVDPVCRTCNFFELQGLAEGNILNQNPVPGAPEVRYTFEVVGTAGLPEIRFLDQQTRFVDTEVGPFLGTCLNPAVAAATVPQGQVILLPEPTTTAGLLIGALLLFGLKSRALRIK